MAQLQKQELAPSSRPNTSATAISNTKEMLANQKRFIIKIPATEKDKTAVKIGINGHHILIPRDIESEVSQSVLNVLNECIEEHLFPMDGDKDSEGQKYEKRQVMRFPYQIIREVTETPKASIETEDAKE
jgi:hypothetical protein